MAMIKLVASTGLAAMTGTILYAIARAAGANLVKAFAGQAITSGSIAGLAAASEILLVYQVVLLGVLSTIMIATFRNTKIVVMAGWAVLATIGIMIAIETVDVTTRGYVVTLDTLVLLPAIDIAFVLGNPETLVATEAAWFIVISFIINSIARVEE